MHSYHLRAYGVPLIGVLGTLSLYPSSSAAAFVGLLVPFIVIAIALAIRYSDWTVAYNPSNEAGLLSFWLLLGTIMMDDLFDIFSQENARAIYLYLGVAYFLLSMAIEYAEYYIRSEGR